MREHSSVGSRKTLRGFVLGLLSLGGVACLLAFASPAPADPDEGERGAPQQRLSGAERSVVVLREIKEVLERMDSRLQRMEEKLARAGQAGPAAQNQHGGVLENDRGGDER